MHKVVPVDDAVRLSGVPTVSRCECCNGYPESSVGSYHPSSSAAQLPSLVLLQGNRSPHSSQNMSPSQGSPDNRSPPNAMAELWLSRNASRYEGIRMSARRIIAHVSLWLQELGNPLPTSVSSSLFVPFGSGSHVHDPVPTDSSAWPLLVIWQRPRPGWVKLNVNGSSRGNPGESSGEGYYGISTNTSTEAQAMLDGILLCSKLGFSNVEVESDSKTVVDTATAPSGHCHWNIWYQMEAIHYLSRSLNISSRHIFREGNAVADALAREASDGCPNSFFSLSSHLPRCIRGSLLLDKGGLGTIRV
ncbi:uncharacterized protein LOC131218107 [Magnolia sinica]|uniref:uncharacterized protein LOC131218107 n=1 Tax=Magnolia sinica TaxID=86752 RepID=UPI00265A31E2|nr:uncharacterized protein LOC131218107 [Magnolia sinica]